MGYSTWLVFLIFRWNCLVIETQRLGWWTFASLPFPHGCAHLGQDTTIQGFYKHRDSASTEWRAFTATSILGLLMSDVMTQLAECSYERPGITWRWALSWDQARYLGFGSWVWGIYSLCEQSIIIYCYSTMLIVLGGHGLAVGPSLLWAMVSFIPAPFLWILLQLMGRNA